MLRLVALGLVAGADLGDPGDPGDLVAAEHSSETRQRFEWMEVIHQLMVYPILSHIICWFNYVQLIFRGYFWGFLGIYRGYNGDYPLVN